MDLATASVYCTFQCEKRRRGYSTDADCARLTQSIPTVFHRGSSKPEVVFQSGFRCGGRDLSTNYDWPRSAQSISAVTHIGDRSERPLPVCWRQGGKCLESISHTFNSRNSSTNRVPRIGTTQKRHTYLWAATMAYGRKLLDQPQPTHVTCETDFDCPIGWLSRFRPYSTVAAVNRKWCSRAVPNMADVILLMDCDWPRTKSGKFYTVYHGARWLHEKCDN